MSYLVTVCDGCQCVALAAVAGYRAQPRACESCRRPLRVVPSRMHGEGERALFAELSRAAKHGGLSATEAYAWAQRIERTLVDGTYSQCWEALSNRLPDLFARQVVLGNNARAQERALQLLRTILDAIATTRGSGLMPSVKAEYPGGVRTG